MQTYVNWDGQKIKISWKNELSSYEQGFITSAHGFCFFKEKLLIVKLQRGWDFPGGHIEQNETPLQCVKREVMEEGSVKGDAELLGYIVVDHNENDRWNEKSNYPKLGYQAFYKVKIKDILPFEQLYESSDRKFIDPADIANYYPGWHDVYREGLRRAMN